MTSCPARGHCFLPVTVFKRAESWAKTCPAEVLKVGPLSPELLLPACFRAVSLVPRVARPTGQEMTATGKRLCPGLQEEGAPGPQSREDCGVQEAGPGRQP